MFKSDVHNIVILGGSFAGLATAHGLLKALPTLKKGKSYKVTLITNSTHFWFSVGAPRAMLKPYPTDIMDSFIPIAKGFERYPSSLFELVHAEVTSLNIEKRSVLCKIKNSQEELSEATSSIHFDTLVITLGSRGPSPLYSIHGSHMPTLNAYKDVQARLPAARTVMVVGGGTAGTETAGEVGHLYGKQTSSPKDITILSGTSRLLVGLRSDIGARAEEMLKGMGVRTVHGVKLTGQKTLESGKTEVTLSNGTTQIVDLLLEATGRAPASSPLPASILDSNGRVTVDPYMRAPSLSSTYATGDIASNTNGGLMYIQAAVPVLVGNIVAELDGKGAKPKEYKPMTTKETQLVPVGPNGGVGALFGWWLPSMAVRMIKAKNMFFPKAMEAVMGTG